LELPNIEVLLHLHCRSYRKWGLISEIDASAKCYETNHNSQVGVCMLLQLFAGNGFSTESIVKTNLNWWYLLELLLSEHSVNPVKLNANYAKLQSA